MYVKPSPDLFGPRTVYTADTVLVDPLGGGNTPAIGDFYLYIDPTYGPQIWRRVKNTSGSSITAGHLCAFKAGSRVEVLAAATDDLPKEMCAGFAPTAPIDETQIALSVIATTKCFSVLVKGRGLVICAGNVSQSAVMQSTATAGQVDDRTPVAGSSLGVFEAANAAGAGASVIAAISCSEV